MSNKEREPATTAEPETSPRKFIRLGSVYSKEAIPPEECCGSAHSVPVGGGVAASVSSRKNGDE
jgi:hypothetical protein